MNNGANNSNQVNLFTANVNIPPQGYAGTITVLPGSSVMIQTSTTAILPISGPVTVPANTFTNSSAVPTQVVFTATTSSSTTNNRDVSVSLSGESDDEGSQSDSE